MRNHNRPDITPVDKNVTDTVIPNIENIEKLSYNKIQKYIKLAYGIQQQWYMEQQQ
jgi:hypothetical protein